MTDQPRNRRLRRPIRGRKAHTLGLALLVAALPVAAQAEFRAHDRLAVATCIDEALDHAGRVSALTAGGWQSLSGEARAPAAAAIGAAFAIRSFRQNPDRPVAEGVELGQQDWARRAGDTPTGDATWMMAGDSASPSYLVLTTDGIASCTIAAPTDLTRDEFLSGASLGDKVLDEADISGGWMIAFDNAPSYNGVLSVLLPDADFFGDKGLSVPSALIFTTVKPPK